jgi:hypothetical protein
MPENDKTGGLWKRHFHWSVLLQWEVLGWIVGSLLAVAGLLLIFDQYAGANVCFVITALFLFWKTVHVVSVSTDGFWERALFTFVLCGLIGVAIVETVRGVNRWAIRHASPEASTLENKAGSPDSKLTLVAPPNVPAKENRSENPVASISHARRNTASTHSETVAKLPPYSRTETFIIDVAYYSNDDGFPLPTAVLGSEDYPLTDAYSRLGEVLMLYAPPDAKQITQITTLDTIDKRSEALVQSLRACIIGEIVTAERGSRKFGISATKGSIADYNPGISPPRSTDYPPEKLVSILGALPFGKNERFLLLYRNRPLLVPEGSEVKLGVGTMGGKYDSMTHALFTIAKPSVFALTFGVAPINAAIGFVPGSFSAQFKSQQAKYTTYSLSVTMKIEIQRDAVSAREIEDYIHWADGLWAFIRDKYDIKRAS